jgi:hypothetical protein
MTATWHHGVHLFGERYPAWHPMPGRLRNGEARASELMELTEYQAVSSRAAHELGDGRSGGHAAALPNGVGDPAGRAPAGTGPTSWSTPFRARCLAPSEVSTSRCCTSWAP